MFFLDLPIEICGLVIDYLDEVSKIKFYNASRSLRKVFAPCHVRRLVLSRSSIATAKTLQEELCQHFCHHIQDLNLSGVQDLTVDVLSHFLPKLASLKTLDVTFTSINLSHITKVCPETLKNININFFKDTSKSKEDGTWNECAGLFRKQEFSNIHFIIFELQDRDIPLMFLKDVPNVQDLKITIADNYEDCNNSVNERFDDGTIDINFSTLSYYIRDCRVTHKTSHYLKGIRNLDFEKIEYIFIMYLERIRVYVSPIFSKLFHDTCSDIHVKVCPVLPQDFMLDLNIVFRAWSKSNTNFNEDFFRKLLKELKDYFPTYICMQSKVNMRVINVVNDWYCIDSCKDFKHNLEISPTKLTLTDFCRRNGSVFRRSRPIGLLTGVKTLSRLVFLRLSNVCIKEDFFLILFSECHQLDTLDIYVENYSRLSTFRSYINSIARSGSVAKNLKNIKLTSEDVDYETLFAKFCNIPSLENIHICEYERNSRSVVADNIIMFIEKSVNLYSLFIEADMPPEALTLLMSPLREAAQRLDRSYLCIEVCDCYRGWNPFVDVFNPSPLHIQD